MNDRDEAHPIPVCVKTGPLWVKLIAYPVYGFCWVVSKIRNPRGVN